eukprot:6532973-Pyramimonas_sp.AAC.1
MSLDGRKLLVRERQWYADNTDLKRNKPNSSSEGVYLKALRPLLPAPIPQAWRGSSSPSLLLMFLLLGSVGHLDHLR